MAFPGGKIGWSQSLWPHSPFVKQSQRIKFRSAAEMLDLFGMQQGGSQYRRLISAFQRVFGATIFFGTDTQRERAMVMHHGRFNFMREARIWYSRDPEQQTLPGAFEINTCP